MRNKNYITISSKIIYKGDEIDIHMSCPSHLLHHKCQNKSIIMEIQL